LRKDYLAEYKNCKNWGDFLEKIKIIKWLN
jgi:hypothetical protein